MNGITGEEIDERRELVRPLLEWAVEGGRTNEQHPHYTAVTEGRDPADPKYSSCGDLAHWLLFRLGCRQVWLNRKEHRGWEFGTKANGGANNVSLLAGTLGGGHNSRAAPTSVRRSPVPGAMFDTGDVVIVWNGATDAHVMVVYEFSPSPLRLVVGEFGQPGGHIAERTLRVTNGELFVGSRQIQRWLPLHLALKDAAERDQLAPVSLPWVTSPEAA